MILFQKVYLLVFLEKHSFAEDLTLLISCRKSAKLCSLLLDSIYGATLTGKVAVWRRYQGGSQLKHDSATKVDDCWRLQNAITLTPDEVILNIFV